MAMILTPLETTGVLFRVVGLMVIAVMSLCLFRYRIKFVYFVNCAVALYHGIIYLEFALDWGWNTRLLVSLGWPFILVAWVGLLLEQTRKRTRE